MRLATLLRGGGRLFLLIAENASLAREVLDRTLPMLDADIRLLRIANSLSAPLTLNRILFQMGGEPSFEPEEEIANAARLLAVSAAGGHRIVLVIEQADTLAREALLFLQDLPRLLPHGLPVPAVLFVATPGFQVTLKGDGLGTLRGEVAPPVVLRGGEAMDDGASATEPAPSPPPNPSAVISVVPLPPELTLKPPAGSPGPGRRGGRRAVVALAILMAGLALIASLPWSGKKILVAVSQPPSAPSAAVDPPPPSPVKREATAPAAAAGPGGAALPAIAVAPLIGEATPGPAPNESPTVAAGSATPSEASVPPEDTASVPSPADPSPDQLRRDFNRFLTSAHPELARLGWREREALFQQYFAARRAKAAQTASAPEVRPRFPEARVIVQSLGASGQESADAARLAARLREQFGTVEFRTVARVPLTPVISYFFPQDAEAARLVAAILTGGTVAPVPQDATPSVPNPFPGTIEAWLPEP